MKAMYKKGDKVQITADSHGHRMPKGMVGTILHSYRAGTESAMYKIRNTATGEARWAPKQDLVRHQVRVNKV